MTIRVGIYPKKNIKKFDHVQLLWNDPYKDWKILARAPGFNPITGMCWLCLKESFFILFHPETASLNKKTEIYEGCKHKLFKFLADCKVT